MNRAQELAWAAGIVEGEGWFADGKQRNRKGKKLNCRQNAIAVGMHVRDIDVLKRLKKILRFGELYGPYKRSKLVQWKVGAADQVCVICLWLFPYLGKRRRTRIQQMFPNFRYFKHHKG